MRAYVHSTTNISLPPFMQPKKAQVNEVVPTVGFTVEEVAKGYANTHTYILEHRNAPTTSVAYVFRSSARDVATLSVSPSPCGHMHSH